jgi:hypothetical protein
MVKEKNIPLSPDAAFVTALAGTAMPFSHSAEDQAERWLRAMRLHGRVGAVLQALGVGETPLTPAHLEDAHSESPPLQGDVVQRVVDRAREHAAEHAAETVGTADLLAAVCKIYDPLIERALYRRGTSCAEIKERLAELGSETVPVEKATPDNLRAHLKAEIDRWGPIIKKAGIYAD